MDRASKAINSALFANLAWASALPRGRCSMLSGEMSMKWLYTLKITEPTIDRPTVQLPNKECLVQIRMTPIMGLIRITIITKAVLTPGRYISRVM